MSVSLGPRTLTDGCNWVNPEAIILGGEPGASGPPFAEAFRESLDRYAQPAIAARGHRAHRGARPPIGNHGPIAAALDRAALTEHRQHLRSTAAVQSLLGVLRVAPCVPGATCASRWSCGAARASRVAPAFTARSRRKIVFEPVATDTR